MPNLMNTEIQNKSLECKDKRCIDHLYADAKTYTEARKKLDEQLRVLKSKAYEVKNVLDGIQAEISEISNKRDSFVSEPHVYASFLIQEAELYSRKIRAEAADCLEQAKKRKTEADNLKSQADDLLIVNRSKLSLKSR